MVRLQQNMLYNIPARALRSFLILFKYTIVESAQHINYVIWKTNMYKKITQYTKLLD